MSKKETKKTPETEVEQETAEPVIEIEETAAAEAPQEEWETKYQKEHDSFLRLAAEYDNYRKRSQ